MDYGKFKYQEQKRAAEAKSKQKVIEVKEVKSVPARTKATIRSRCAICAASSKKTATRAR
jgi:translation initiation factor IF-3